MTDHTPVLTAVPYDPHGLTVADAALRLGIGPEAVRQRIRRGTLKAYKVSGRVYVQLTDPPPPSEQPYGAYVSEHVATPVRSAVPNTGPVISDDQLAVVVDQAVSGYREALAAVRQQVTTLQQAYDDIKTQLCREQETRRHDVDELLRLLEQAQMQLSQAPTTLLPAPIDCLPDGAASLVKRRRWWWPFGRGA